MTTGETDAKYPEEGEEPQFPQAELDHVPIWMRGLPQFAQAMPGQTDVKPLTTVQLNRTIRHEDEAKIKLSRLVNGQGGVLYTWNIEVEGIPWGKGMTLLEKIDKYMRDQYT